MVPSCTSALVVAREGEGGAALRGRRWTVLAGSLRGDWGLSGSDLSGTQPRDVTAKRCVVPRAQPPGSVAHTAVWGAGPGTAPRGAVSRIERAARLRSGLAPTTGFGRVRRDP